MHRKHACRNLVLVTAGLILAAQASLPAHAIDHAGQQADVTCAVCSFDGYGKVLPPSLGLPLAQAVSDEIGATGNFEPPTAVPAGEDRIRAPPRLC